MMSSGISRMTLATLFLASTVAMAWCQGASTVKEIEVKGLVNISKEVILATMRTKVGQAYAQAPLDEDRKAIQELGYFSAVDVRARELDPQNWAVLVEVVEFPKVKEIRVVGNTVVPVQAILGALKSAPSVPIEPEKVFCLRSLKPASDAIEKLYADKGYFARVSEFGPLADSPETISVTVLEMMVNDVKVVGAARTRPSVLNKIIKTRPGQPFNSDRWRKDLVGLYNTQWFEKVEPVVKDTDEVNKINLIIDVKEQRTGIFNVGMQMDPRSSFAGMVRFTDTNFRGSGQNYSLDFIQGTQGGGASLSLDWGNPFMDDRGTAMGFSLYSRNIYRFTGTFGNQGNSLTNERYYERHTGTSLTWTRPIKEGTTFLSHGFRIERTETSNIEEQTSGFIQQDGLTTSLSTAYIVNRRDLDVDPSRGDWMRVQLEPGWNKITKVGGDTNDPGLIGSHTFLRTDFEYRKYWSPQPPRKQFDDPRRVIAFRAHYGLVSGTVPFFEQFFVGGSNTLRGYPEDRFWGKQMISLNLEYRHPVQKSFNAIAFLDYGGAWGGFGTVNNYTQSNSAVFKLGYGLGFSFRTPLGPIRLDFGWNQDGGSRTHFMIGTSF